MNHLIILLFLLILFFPLSPIRAEEYSFDLAEIEKKAYQFGGYIEFRPLLYGLDKDASLYKLKLYNRNKENVHDEYNFTLQINASYEKGKAKLYTKLNTTITNSYLGWDDDTALYEGYLSIKSSSSALSFDIGKKTVKWGKGYAWNPVAFVDKAKNPDDPELSMEGFIIASVDYIKSFSGPLQTFSYTPVIVPVYEHINEDFGNIDHINFAQKIYLLFYDTDIDLMALTGASKTSRFGLDFSRNVTSNFEIHGEFALINDFQKVIITSDGIDHKIKDDTKSYVMGLRYLTESDTTIIGEYYHNGTGYSQKEMHDYFSYINKAYDSYIFSGDDGQLKKALQITPGNFGKPNPMKDYLYLRLSQKEPWDILYFSAALTTIYNLGDESCSLSPEVQYQPFTNLELMSKLAILIGEGKSEFGEKRNNWKLEFRARYYF